MAVRDLAFRYSTEGAKAAQRADSKVREQVRETGKTADKQSGKVDRWMQRNRKAIQMTAVAALGAATAIVSSSSRMRAELSGVQSALGLFADTIIGDVLPSTGSLAGTAIDVVMAYRNLSDSVRSWISALVTAAGVVAGVVLVGGKLAAALSAILPSAFALGQAFGVVATAAKFVGGAIVAVVGGITATTAALAIGVAAILAFAAAYITNWNGVRDKTNSAVGKIIGFIKGLASDALAWGKKAIGNLASAIADRARDARDAAGDVRDRIADRIKDVVGSARGWGRELMNDFIAGIRGRLGALKDLGSDVREAIPFVGALERAISAITKPLKQLTQEIADYLPQSPADKGPLSDLDKVGPGMADTLADGMESNTGRVARGAESLAGGMAGASMGGRGGIGGGVRIESLEIVIQGSGNRRRDGRNAAREVEDEFARTLGSRGA